MIRKREIIPFSFSGNDYYIEARRVNKRIQAMFRQKNVRVQRSVFEFKLPKIHPIRPIRPPRIRPRMGGFHAPPPIFRGIRKPSARVFRHKRIIKRQFMTGLEVENLKRIADRSNVSRDLVDWDAHIDRTLTYHENKRRISEIVASVSAPSSRVFSSYDRMASNAQFQAYIETLQWKAGAGDVHAMKELAKYRAMRH